MNNQVDGEFKIEDPKRGRLKIVFFVLILIAVLIISFLIYFFTKVNQAASNESQSIRVVIERGLSTQAIAAKLAQAKIINSPWVFNFYSKLNGAGSKMQAGEYILDRKMSIAEIVEILTAGKVIPQDRRITIPEGWSNAQIANYLALRNIATFDEFNKTLKQTQFAFKFFDVAKPYDFIGFLFPDTYQISKAAGASELIDKMLKNFESQISEQMLKDIQTKHLKLSDVIILASIIEKEVGRNSNNQLAASDFELLQKERELVASVFYNRLKRNMPLQSDATVNYVTGKFERRPTLEDIKIKSDYNTYLIKGLPPGPICNPGLGAIKAAIYPGNSDYFYFLNKEDGEAVFSKTLEEHNANKAKYLH